MARDNDTIRATPRYRPCKKIHFWFRLAERGDEDRRENFKKTRRNLLKLKLPTVESKQSPKNAIVWTQNILSVFIYGRKTFVPF